MVDVGEIEDASMSGNSISFRISSSRLSRSNSSSLDV